MKQIFSSVGKKVLMAVTGQLLILFIIVHAAGNSTIYFSSLNTYAEHLRSFFPLVWANRLVMLTAISVHIISGIQLTFENRTAKPERYAVKKNLRTTFASRSMIWTGLAIAAFLIYHLLHFTFQVTQPAFAASVNPDPAGRPDVSAMVIAGFQNIWISLAYIVSMTALLLHLMHGIESSFQSLGLNNERTHPVVEKAGLAAAYILFIAYTAIPIFILFGMMKG